MNNVKSSKKVSHHFAEACGRIYTTSIFIILFIYISKYIGMKYDISLITAITQCVVAVLSLAMLVQAGLYTKRHLWAIYRFFVLRTREYNKMLVYLFFLPGMTIMLIAWAWILLFSYLNVIKEFMDYGTIRPMIAFLAGEIFLFMYVTFLLCMRLAKIRGIDLFKPDVP